MNEGRMDEGSKGSALTTKNRGRSMEEEERGKETNIQLTETARETHG